MKLLAPIVLAAGLALSAGTAATAMTDPEVMSMGHSMLTGAVFNSLSAQGYSTDGIENLTLNEVALLRTLLTDDMDQATRDGQIELILERARAR